VKPVRFWSQTTTDAGIRPRVIANPPYIELMARSMMRTNARRAIEKAQPDGLGGADKCPELYGFLVERTRG
jgi:hypothetical protein